VLDAALDLFARHGFDGTSLQLIADHLGVTKAAVYYHFRTKGEILAALVQPAFDDLNRLLTEAGTCGRAVERREAGLTGYVDYLLQHRQVATFLDRDVSALAQPEVREPVEALTRQVRALLTAGIDETADPRTALWAAATLRGLSEALLVAPVDCEEQWLRDQLLELGRHMISGYRRARPRKVVEPASEAIP
jgi:AcrR family transcriptional regulator